ncbi:MAG: hypothetical protein ACRD1B_11625 [Thermoanaerobaculia bacterium]
MRRALAAAALLTSIAGFAGAQDVHWKSEFLFYLDNTEFSTPYRDGETILGAWFKTYLELATGGNTHVKAGVFGDHRSGDTKFLNPVKPILAFLWQSDRSLAVLGALEPRDRHGYLEPLEATTLELTRPIEYGLQWVENQKRFHIDAYLNWQHLNTTQSREILDTGFAAWWNPVGIARLEGQLHWLHHGGQLHAVGPVTNNIVGGPGFRLEDELKGLGRASFSAFYLLSTGPVAMDQGGESITGNGVYLKASAEPARLFELAFIFWRGHNFITHEGDHNYGSIGATPPFYRADRRYEELALIKKFRIAGTVDADAQVRLHHIDGKLEYSYRLAVRAPFDIKIH